MMMPELIEIGKGAAQLIMDVYKADDFQIESKADDSPVTKADKLSNEYIVKALQRLDASIPIISEEESILPYEIRKDHEKVWLIDPIDGTKEFIKKNGEFTINIALVENNRPVLGLVFIPATGAYYYAEKNKGAYYVGKNEKPICIHCNTPDFANRFTIACSRSHINEATMKYMEQFDYKLVRIGSSLKTMKIAEGMVDLYPRLGPTWEWDTAAPQIIVEEAGGHIYQWNTKIPLVYNKSDLLNPHFIALGNAEPVYVV